MADGPGAVRKAILALVRGRVQGVGFRYEARSMARSLGITGWISNLHDGGVEAYAEGPIEAVDRFIGWLRHGPPGARVESLDLSERRATGHYSSFEVE